MWMQPTSAAVNDYVIYTLRIWFVAPAVCREDWPDFDLSALDASNDICFNSH